MAKYFVSEPSPSTASYIRCGRGGAGNTFRKTASSSSSSPSSSDVIDMTSPPASPRDASHASRRFFSGIGGAGNIHPVTALPSVADSLDDALRHAAARDNPSVGYCGRGGAGNIYRRKQDQRSREADAASFVSVSSSSHTANSVKSDRSAGKGLWNRLSGSFARE